MKPFILGLRAFHPASAFMSTASLSEAVGHDTGNLAFHHAINQHFGGELRVVDWSAPREEIVRQPGTALIPCANQLGPQANLDGPAAKFQSLKTPMVAIGLGAQGAIDGLVPLVPEGTLKWVKAIADRAPGNAANIGVRGDFSLKVLEHHGLADRAVIIGCPSLFINPNPRLGRQIARKGNDHNRIAVAAGHHGWLHLSRIEASLTALAKATSGSYIGQSPLEMLALTRGEADSLPVESIQACRDYACPEMTVSEFVAWSKTCGAAFFDATAWMEHCRRFDLVIGTRIHGVMLALQAGVPAVCIVHDSRTLELCRTMKVPHVLASAVKNGITRKQLSELARFDAEVFDRNRSMLARRYCDFLQANGLRPVEWLREMACAEATA